MMSASHQTAWFLSKRGKEPSFELAAFSKHGHATARSAAGQGKTRHVFRLTTNG
jgi:hypothetical protein